LSQPRRYSPLNRAHGLRRLPNESYGLPIVASLALHVVFLAGLVSLTNAPVERQSVEVSAILADLAAAAPAGDPTSEPASRPAAGATTTTGIRPPVAPSRPSERATAAEPSVASRPTVSTPTPSPIPGERVAPLGVGTTLVSTVPGPSDAPEPAASRTADLDPTPDPGWAEPSPVVFPSPSATRLSATRLVEALTPVPRLREGSQEQVASAAPSLPVREPIRPGPSLPPAPQARPRLVPDEPATIARQAAMPTPRPPTTSPSPVVQAGSPLGINRERALVRLEGPRTWVTDQPSRIISGTVLGGVSDRLVVYVNGSPMEVNLSGRTFEAAVMLHPGANELRAVATGPDGLEADDTIMVQYNPRTASNGIVLTSPSEGLTLGPDDPPVTVVEGELDNKRLTTAWIVANDRRISVAVNAGRFRQAVLISDPVVNVWAEASDGDVVHRSGTVTIRTAGARARSGVLVMQWPAGIDRSTVDVTATWRAHSERLDTIVQTMSLPPVGETASGAPDMFFLRSLKPGVYTLIVRYRGLTPMGDVRPTLYLPDKDHLAPRALRPLSLDAGGRRVMAKVLMPQAVLWSQDDWFSGMSESVDTVTKFRIPEGITWVERKDELP
jgi:hypothetical protein